MDDQFKAERSAGSSPGRYRRKLADANKAGGESALDATFLEIHARYIVPPICGAGCLLVHSKQRDNRSEIASCSSTDAKALDTLGR